MNYNIGKFDPYNGQLLQSLGQLNSKNTKTFVQQK